MNNNEITTTAEMTADNTMYTKEEKNMNKSTEITVKFNEVNSSEKATKFSSQQSLKKVKFSGEGYYAVQTMKVVKSGKGSFTMEFSKVLCFSCNSVMNGETVVQTGKGQLSVLMEKIKCNRPTVVFYKKVEERVSEDVNLSELEDVQVYLINGRELYNYWKAKERPAKVTSSKRFQFKDTELSEENRKALIAMGLDADAEKVVRKRRTKSEMAAANSMEEMVKNRESMTISMPDMSNDVA